MCLEEKSFCEAAGGSEPAKDFISGPEPKMRAEVLRTISLLEDNGGELREPISKPLGEGIFELRVQAGNNPHPVFFLPGERGDSDKRFCQEIGEDAIRRNGASETILRRIFEPGGTGS